MDKAGAGLEGMAEAADDMHDLMLVTMPQWFGLFERFVDALERGVDVAENATVRSGLASMSSVYRSTERERLFTMALDPNIEVCPECGMSGQHATGCTRSGASG